MYEGGAAGDRARFLRRRAGGHAPPGDGRSGMDEAPSGNGRTSVWDDEVADGPAPVPGAWIAKSDGWSTSWECPPCWRHLSPPEPETDFLPSQTMLCPSIGNSPTSHTAWFAGTTIIYTSPLLHQRIPRRGELQKFPRAAAGVRVRALGDTFIGPVDFETGQAAAERQSQQLPITFLRRRQLRKRLALAESRGGELTQDFSDNAEAPPRGIAGALVRVFGRSAAQDGQRLRGRLPQDRLLTRVCHIGHNARGRVIVRRGRRPNSPNSEFPSPKRLF